MSYCLNPRCSSPNDNDKAATVCITCNTALLLRERYRAIKLLGQGGFGRTFLAVDVTHDLKSRCVIKQLFPQQHDAESQKKAIALFQHEAQQLEQLGTHSHIPALYDSFVQDGSHYLIQEFIDGQNLAQELHQSGSYTENQIWQLLTDVIPTLQFIHHNHVIHRDIKPANIIRRQSDGEIFLVDLGAAKQATGTALALTGTVIGSAEYTAPEQARGKANFSSDIYSLGVTCIHLLTEMSPFSLYDIGDGRWVWQDYLKNPVSYRLKTLLDKMIQHPTNHRYQTADGLQNALQQKLRTANRMVGESSLPRHQRENQSRDIGQAKGTPDYGHKERLLSSVNSDLSPFQAPPPASLHRQTDYLTRNRAYHSHLTEQAHLTKRFLTLGIMASLGIAMLGVVGVRYMAMPKMERHSAANHLSVEGESLTQQPTNAAIDTESDQHHGREADGPEEQARQMIRAMNQVQITGFLENQTFSDELSNDLAHQIRTYSFRSYTTLFPTMVVNEASQPATGIYRTYVSVVRAVKETATGEYTFQTLMCEAEQVPINGGPTSGWFTSIENGVIVCPQGFRQLAE